MVRYYNSHAKNEATIISNLNETGMLASDESTESVPLKIQTLASFILPYDAAKFGDIYIKGSLYTGRTEDSNKWIDFIHPLKKQNLGEYYIEKTEITNSNGYLFYAWSIYVNQYGYGPGAVYAGLKNVEIEYR